MPDAQGLCDSAIELDRAMELLKEQERICRELGNNDGLQRSLGNQAGIHQNRGELDRAMELLKEQERICRELGNDDGLQRSLGNQALIHQSRGELDRAMELHQEEERICREIGNDDGLQRSLGNQALIHQSRGELDRAMELHQEKERICREIGNDDGLQRSLGNQALIYKAKGELDRAMELLKERERICREIGNDDGLQRSLGNQTLIQQSRDLERNRAELENVRHQLHEEIERRTSLDVRCDELTWERDQTEKALNAQANELEQLKSALAAEKNRAVVAEQEVKSVLQNKSQSEQDLQHMLHDLTEIAKQQAQENLRLVDDLNSEQSQRTDVEHQLEVLRQEVEEKEIALVAEKESIQEYCDALQQKFDALTESFSALLLEETTTATEEEKRQRLLAENNLKEIISAKDEELQSLHLEHAKLNEELDAHRKDLATVVQERETAKSIQKNLEDELAAAVLGLEESDKLARSISSERDRLSEELGNEQHVRRSVENNLKEIISAKDEELQSLHLEHAKLSEELEAHRKDLATVVQERETAKSIQKNLEDELAAAVLGLEESDKLARSIPPERDWLSEELGNEQHVRRSVEESLNQVVQAKEKIEKNLRAVSKKKANEKTSQQTKIQNLKGEIEKMLVHQKSLESMLVAAEKELAEKEAALQSLSGKFEQAISQLEAETVKWHATEKVIKEIRQESIPKKPVSPALISEESLAEGSEIKVKEPDLSGGPDSGQQPAVDLTESSPADQVLVYDEPSVPLDDKPKEIEIVEDSTVEDLNTEPHKVDLPVLSDAAPADSDKAQSDTYAESGPAETGLEISSGDKWEEEPRVTRPSDDDRVMELHKEKEQICRELGNKDGLQRSLGNQALIHQNRGELDLAMELLKEQERICRETGNKDGLQRSLGNQALIHRDLGEPDLAMELLKEEERICRELGNKDGLQRSLGNQALIHRDLGEPDLAMELHKEKERICREIENKKGIVLSLVNQAGILVYDRQDPAAALPLLEEAYQIAVLSGFESLVKQLSGYIDKVQKMNVDPENQKLTSEILD